MKEICPHARFVGIAGPRMRSVGCHCLFDMSQHAGMLLGALGAAGKGLRAMSIAGTALRRLPFDAAVVIDSPVLHIPLAGKAREAGVPVLYYVAPQLWAWHPERIRKLRDRVDEMAVVLPFEEEYFRTRGIRTQFVGHPLFDTTDQPAVTKEHVAQIRRPGSPLIALLPGSRGHVIEEVLPGQLEVAAAVRREWPTAGFGVSVAGPQFRSLVAQMTAESGVPVQLVEGSATPLIEAADLVLVASGTTTLEVALHGKPMIVMYNASRLMYQWVGRHLIQTDYLSLPNILAGREVVPEFMPYYRSTEPIVAAALRFLRDESLRERVSNELRTITAPLASGNASERAARMLLDLACRAHR